METLVDLKKLPARRDYAAWAYEGSGVEKLWSDFEEFFMYYLSARREISATLPEYADFDIRLWFLQIMKRSFPEMAPEKMDSAAGSLYENFWNNYKSGCHVKEDVLQTLPRLKEKYRLGVVSNFLVVGGIEELLGLLDIAKYFDFIVTSVAEGHRKPFPGIYRRALELSRVSPGQVVFVGDDLENDYNAPLALGMTPFFLDRYDRHMGLKNRVTDFYELAAMLLGP